MSDDMREAVARAICGQSCLRAYVFGKPCLKRDGSNGPCEATLGQLQLSWRWDAAAESIAVIEKSKPPSPQAHTASP